MRRGARRAPVRVPPAAAGRGGDVRAPVRPREGHGRAAHAHRRRGLRPRARPAAAHAHRDPRPGRRRGQRPPGGVLGGARRAQPDPRRGGPRGRPRHRGVRPGRDAHGHRRREPPDPRRAHPGRQPAAAPARPARQHAHLLAAPPGAVVPVLRALHRPDEPGAAGRRGPARDPLRARDRLRRAGPPRHVHPRGRAPVAGRPGAAPPARRHHRQHAPQRVLHRQAVQPGLRTRPPGSARDARLRDAAAPGHGPRPGTVAALAGRARSGSRRTRATLVRWGTRLHDRFLLPEYAMADIADVVADLQSHGFDFDAVVARPVRRVPLPPSRLGGHRGRAGGAPLGDRAVARPGRGGQRRRHRALRRLLPGAHPGQGQRRHPRASRRHVQRHRAAALADPFPGRARGRRPVPGLAAVLRVAPDDRGPLAAGLRRRRPLERPLARRLHLPRRAPGRARVRDVPGQRRRGRGSPRRPVRPRGAHARLRGFRSMAGFDLCPRTRPRICTAPTRANTRTRWIFGAPAGEWHRSAGSSRRIRADPRVRRAPQLPPGRAPPVGRDGGLPRPGPPGLA